jgi:hypothetical protein
MSWRWHRPATGSSCTRRCAAGRSDGVAKKIAEQSILTTPAWLSHIVERSPRLNDGLAALSVPRWQPNLHRWPEHTR